MAINNGMENKCIINDDSTFCGTDHRSAKHILAKFDANPAVNYDDFRALCTEVFGRNEVKENEWRISDMFNTFDVNADGALKGAEQRRCYEWLRKTVEPVNVLLVVDVQNDFIDGTLALRNCPGGQDGVDVVAPINRLLKQVKWDKVIYTLDWHPENHISFYENLHAREVHPDSKITKENAKPGDTVLFLEPCVEQTLWPKHCVKNTWGSELHKDLIISPNSIQIHKGVDPDIESYSIFSAGSASFLKASNVLSSIGATHLYVCGLAYDICVKETSLDALQLGYRIAVISDCCGSIDMSNTERAKMLVSQNGGLLTNSDHVLSMINESKPSLVMNQRIENVSVACPLLGGTK
ncbi:hypothetical protein KM043_018079 [Ampulex compressa]|nr:hypothetical protein KM043_018079 [Ampulex compressa]